jgi:hypothetical protein
MTTVLLALALAAARLPMAAAASITGAFTSQQIQNVGSGLCWTLDGAGPAIVMSTCAGLTSQLFSYGVYDSNQPSTLMFTLTSTGLPVAVGAGSAALGQTSCATAAAAQQTCNNGIAGRVGLATAPTCSVVFSVSGATLAYQIYSGALAWPYPGTCCYSGSCTSGTACLSATGGAVDGYAVSLTLATCSAANTAQQWALLPSQSPPSPPSPPLPPPPSPPASVCAPFVTNGTCTITVSQPYLRITFGTTGLPSTSCTEWSDLFTLSILSSTGQQLATYVGGYSTCVSGPSLQEPTSSGLVASQPASLAAEAT